METLWRGLVEALYLLLSLDPTVWRIALRTLAISGSATVLSALLGIPLGIWLVLGRVPARRFWLTLTHTGMALPPVVVGLMVALLFWRTGPLGFLEWIYTPTAMVIAQTILATPMVAGVVVSGLQALGQEARWQLLGLGASGLQAAWVLVQQARGALLAAVMAGFGTAVSEVGASLMVGGNLKGYTRVLTTAVVLETRRGNFARALALGFILLGLAFWVNAMLTVLQQREADPDS